MRPTRRSILQGWLAASAAGLSFATLPSDVSAQQGSLLPPTRSWGPQEQPTLSSTAGPFYTPNTPVKRNFRNDARGENLTLVGFVVDRRCRPIGKAPVDLWHGERHRALMNLSCRLRCTYHQQNEVLLEIKRGERELPSDEHHDVGDERQRDFL